MCTILPYNTNTILISYNKKINNTLSFGSSVAHTKDLIELTSMMSNKTISK